jgi:hypothetical protein
MKRRNAAWLVSAATLVGSAFVGAGAASAQAPPHWARLYITDVGGGYVLVVVDGKTTQANAEYGVRVMGDDEWFDDFLFGMGIPGLTRTGPDGSFNISATVRKSALNEDWGGDEVYAIADVGIDIRTNTISRSF